jgi:Domain of unknown function (DUF4136)
MKKSFVISLLLSTLLIACAPSIKVTMDYDKQANFSKYKTYTLTPESSALQVNELNRRRILGDIESQLSLKGLAKSESGDLLVDVRISAQERKEATSNSSGGYGYRWGGGFTTVSVQTYIDGTLIISLIDAGKKELVWQGSGLKTIDPDATPQQREQNISAAVAAIMKNYPPGAVK